MGTDVVVVGAGPTWLLDSYHRERHPVGAKALSMTDRLTTPLISGSRMRIAAFRYFVRTMLLLGPIRRRLLDRVTGLGIIYPARLRDAHRLVGRRAPDWRTDTGRLYESLREGSFVLVDGTGVAPEVVQPWAHLVRHVRAATMTKPRLALVRPDGYIAWATDAVGAPDLTSALVEWCGPGLDSVVEVDSTNAAT